MTLFLTKGAAIDARDLDGSTALFKAAENGRMAVVRLLVEAGANVNLPGRSDVSPVAAGAFMGSEPIVRYLIEKGADLNGIDKTGKGPLVYAVGRGFPPVALLLLDHGVDVNARYGDGLTALMWAAGHSDDAGTKDVVQVMKLLVDRGAKLDEQDDQGRTALMIAAVLGHTAAAEALLARGADRTLKDKDGKTASDLASVTALRAELAGRALTPAAEIGLDLHPGEILRQRGDVVGRGRLHQVRHARIVAARAVAEGHHGRLQIFLPLAGKPRRGAVALEVFEVAAAAADRGGGCLGRLGGTSSGAEGCCRFGHFCFVK